jgi:integrase
MATYRKRGDSWRVEICVNGIRASSTHDTKAQAKHWAIHKEVEMKSYDSDIPRHTLREALEKYRDTVSANKKGAKWEMSRINKFITTMPFINEQLTELKTSTLAQWRDDNLKKIQPASVRREMTVIASMFEIARREWGWIKESPLKDVKKPSSPPHRDRLIEDDEISRLINELGFVEGSHVETKKQQIAVAFLFALETAMRVGEIVELTWDRVNLDKRFVTLADSKNGDGRDIPLSNRAVDLLKTLKPIDAVNVFTVSGDNMSTLFRRARDKAGIVDLHFHDTRHQAITNLAKKLSVIQLARMVGHRDLKSLMIYYNETATELANLLN